MGRMSELAQELAELKHCGEILIGISESLTEMFSVADAPVRDCSGRVCGDRCRSGGAAVMGKQKVNCAAGTREAGLGHAFLSASASHRWLACPPSAKLCAGKDDTASAYAQQGTDCHELCAYLVEKSLGKDVKDPTENLTYYDQEMQDCAESYCSYVLEQIEEAKKQCPDPQILIEQRLDFSRWVENGFGTGDCVIVSDDVLQIIDYKHGLGVLMSAERNPQMMCYAHNFYGWYFNEVNYGY